ncbi:hypothetical protein [Polyangium fumosum]|uniref:Uncharacterized protein n=1 Tax=Polyangium fumosum TaxID=889272 RepID=A0A4U1IIQ1_9BACT|nr:hypothetical protein [Polyangium fumosum]TKC93681.1 hypothetical protein E8A74_49090 [Polyangium fumosum]
MMDQVAFQRMRFVTRAITVAFVTALIGCGPKAQPAASPSTSSEDTDTVRKALRAAYADGVKVAKITDTRCAPGVDVWLLSPGHIVCREDDRHVLFFWEDGTPIEPLPQVDEDDTIVLAVVSSDSKKAIEELQVTVCDGASPVRIAPPGGGNKANEVGDVAAKSNKLHNLRVVKGCSSDRGASATLRAGSQESKNIQVPTLALHRFTIGLGLIYDFSTRVDYRAVTVKGENTPIIVEDKHLVGIAPPIPFVAFRPVPVDVKRSRLRSPGEWFGVALGISVVEPLDHLYLAGLVEPFPGFGFLLGAHFHTVPTLAGGYQSGDRFTGGTEVPVDKRWQIEATRAFLGLSVDASLLTRLLQAIE